MTRAVARQSLGLHERHAVGRHGVGRSELDPLPGRIDAADPPGRPDITVEGASGAILRTVGTTVGARIDAPTVLFDDGARRIRRVGERIEMFVVAVHVVRGLSGSFGGTLRVANGGEVARDASAVGVGEYQVGIGVEGVGERPGRFGREFQDPFLAGDEPGRREVDDAVAVAGQEHGIPVGGRAHDRHRVLHRKE